MSSNAWPTRAAATKGPSARFSTIWLQELRRTRTTTQPVPATHFTGHSVENDHAAALAALSQIGEGLRRLVDRIGARDQFIELQPAAAVQADQARKILARPRRSEITAGERLLAERSLLCIQGDLILRAGDTHDHGRSAASQDAPCLFGDPARAHAIEGVIRAAAGQLVQRLAAF